MQWSCQWSEIFDRGLKGPAEGAVFYDPVEAMQHIPTRMRLLNTITHATNGPQINVATTSKRREIPLPTPVPIVHSSAFLEQSREEQSKEGGGDQDQRLVKSTRKKSSVVSSNGGGLLAETLQSIDEHLQSIEEKPNPLHKTLFDLSQGPMAQAAGQGISKAASLTGALALKAGGSLAPVVKKATAPVAEWAKVNGPKAAQAMMMEAVRRLGDEGQKKKGSDEDKGKRK